MAGAHPSVSVIIPAFNASALLPDAIESALRQTAGTPEVIVIDDGSTDSTADVVQQFQTRIRYFRQPNSGAAAARNNGISRATGDFIAFLDADDWWHPTKLEHQLRHLGNCNECGAVYSHWCVCANPRDARWQSTLDAVPTVESCGVAAHHSGWLYHELLLDSVIHTSAVLFRRSTVDRVGLFREDLLRGQDLDYWLRASRLVQIHRLDAVLSAYREHPASATGRPTDTNFRAAIIEDALKKWGYASPDGSETSAAEVRKVLGRSWQDFGYLHLQRGSPTTAYRSFRHALAFGSPSARLLQLLLRARLKMAIRSD